MSFLNAPPLSASLGALSSLKPDFPSEGHQSVAGEVESRPPAPTDSTEFIGNPQQQFPEQSINSLQVVNGNGDDRSNNRSSTNIWGKTVKQLRLSEALTLPETASIHEARCKMAAERAAVLVLTDSNALLTGILTNKGFATRVIGQEIDLVNTPVSKVMTKNPNFVLSDTLVVEALQTMVQGKFRQLPVVENGKVIGLVRPMLCLFDEMGNKETTAENYDKVIEAAMQSVTQRGLIVKHLPTKGCCMVPETTTIYEACQMMAAEIADAVLVTDSNELLCGILTKKDIVSRVIPCGFDVVNTPVSKVMTKKPMFVRCYLLPMEFLEKIVQGKAIQLLVNENGRDNCFDYQLLSLCGGVLPTTQTNDENHKIIEDPLPAVNVNGNSEWDETNGPGLTSFVHVTNSSYPNIGDSVNPPPEHTAVDPAEHTSNPGDLTAAAPGFSPFVHMATSPLGELVVPPPQHTEVGPTEENSGAWDGTAGPGFSPFEHVNNSPYPNDLSDKLVDPPAQHTTVGPMEHTSNGNHAARDLTAAAPGFSPFVHMTTSPLGEFVVPPPQHTAVGPPGNPVPGAWDGSVGPGFSPFVHMTTSPSVNVDSSGELPQNTAARPPKKSHNGSSTNIGGFKEEKTLKQLQLSEALTVDETTTIYEACCQMAAQRADVIVLTGSDGKITGILTNKDIVTRVIACEIDLVTTPVIKVMTKEPRFVMSDTLVVDAQQWLLQVCVKQLPVMENDKVIGFFDGTQSTTTAAARRINFFDIYSRGTTMKQLPLKHALTLPETTTIYEACCRMAAGGVDVVVLTKSNADLLGILNKKDIVSRVIPSGIDVVNTPVSEVVTVTDSPIFVACDTFPVETMQLILKGKISHFLIIENDEDNGLVYQLLYLCCDVLQPPPPKKEPLYESMSWVDSQEDDAEFLEKFYT